MEPELDAGPSSGPGAPHRRRTIAVLVVIVAVGLVVLLVSLTVGDGSSSKSNDAAPPTTGVPDPGTTSTVPSHPDATEKVPPANVNLPAPGAPLTQNIYSFAGANMLSPTVANVPPRIYVPNSDANTVDVIDPATYKIVAHYPVGRLPQHVVPSWDLKKLYVTNDYSNSLTPVDPMTGKPSGANIPVDDPYNMYFTPDGSQAIVVAEAHHHLDFRDAQTFKLQNQVNVTCVGVDHMDFSADGSYLIASCEFSGEMVKVDLKTHTVIGYLAVGGKPQDVKVDPAGKIFYVADMNSNGLIEIDGDAFTKVGFLPTGPEAHGLYPSRDAKFMYVSNRGGAANQGSVSVVDFTTRQVVATWPIPAPSTPDMGGVSADGKVLWLAGRRTSEVYALDTTTGKLLARIKVGAGAHGLCVWPQPGRFSLGHTGILR